MIGPNSRDRYTREDSSRGKPVAGPVQASRPPLDHARLVEERRYVLDGGRRFLDADVDPLAHARVFASEEGRHGRDGGIGSGWLINLGTWSSNRWLACKPIDVEHPRDRRKARCLPCPRRPRATRAFARSCYSCASISCWIAVTSARIASTLASGRPSVLASAVISSIR